MFLYFYFPLEHNSQIVYLYFKFAWGLIAPAQQVLTKYLSLMLRAMYCAPAQQVFVNIICHMCQDYDTILK